MEKHTMKDGRDINRSARRKKATITAVQWVLAIIVLIITSKRNKQENQPPASLGEAYFREDR